MTLTQITEKGIKDGEIVNADINASAAIAGTKIDPSFTSNLTITNTQPKIFLTDSNNTSDFSIQNENGNLNFYDETNTTSRIRIISTGKVGIGTTSPVNNLHLHQDDSEKCILQFTNTTTGTGATDGLHVGHVANENVAFWNHEDTDINIATDNTHRMVIKNDGLVGINLGSAVDPLELIHMKGNLYIVKNSSNANEGNAIKFQTKTGGFSTSYGAAIHGLRVGDTSSYLRFDTGGQSEKMRLDENGNLGIGTTAPSELLTVGDGDLKFYNSNAGSYHRTTFIEFGNSSNRITSEANFGSGGSSNYAAGYKFTTKNFNSVSGQFENLTPFVIQANGNCGIGTTSPANNLHLGASGADQVRSIKIDGTNGSSELQGVILESDGANARFNIKMGIGGGTPSTKLTLLHGGGLTFNGDTAAANALDDYEEGTWTPVPLLTYNPGSRSITAGTSEGIYVKIGRFVHVEYKVQWTAISGSGAFNVGASGLPYAADGTVHVVSGTARSNQTGYTFVAEGVQSSQINVFRRYDNGGPNENDVMYGFATYQTT